MPIDPRIPQCHFIRMDGRRCGSPALRSQRFCYYHYEASRPTMCLDIPPLEDANAIHFAITDIARAVADERLDLKRATVLGYLLQTATANLRRVQFNAFPDSMVRELPQQDPYFHGVHTERGEEAQRRDEAGPNPFALPKRDPQAASVETQLAASRNKTKSGA